MARVVRRDPGVWETADDADHARDGLGLLVVAGTLVRRVGMAGRQGAELLSVGDVLQPARHDGEEAALPFDATWHVLTPLRLAVLDLAWMARMAPYPEVMAEISGRIMLRSRRLRRCWPSPSTTVSRTVCCCSSGSSPTATAGSASTACDSSSG